ncbi:MAG: hypothetical protein AAGF46_05610 [Pseudomonadota bacterium]
MTEAPSPNPRRGRWQLLLLAAVFFGPLVIATAMYYGGFLRAAAVNYGTFVEPAVSLEPKLHFDTGLRSRWTLLVVAADECARDCEAAIETLSQVRLATGREIDRIDRALIAAAPEQAATDDAALVRFGPTSELATALAPLPRDAVYIMDPIGNVVLSYPLDADRKKMHGDLKKLLKLSRIG